MTGFYTRKINSLIIQVYSSLTSLVSSNRGNQTLRNFQPPNKTQYRQEWRMWWNAKQYDAMKWYVSKYQYSLNRIYMILLRNTSRVHDPWGTREVHIPTRTISKCLCEKFKRTIINQTIFARTISTYTKYNLYISPSPARTLHAQLILNIMPMHVHNIISIRGW